jgi:hypothetical protein
MMKTDDSIGYDEKSFVVRGSRVLLIGGEFHYFRTPAELWEDRLVKMRRAGANLISTYIPWNWHEPVEGRVLWDGDRDLSRFLELCGKHGLYVIVKPGPYCCAELDFGGHPDWLLNKNVRIRRLDEGYLNYAGKWYREVAGVIRPHLVTRGGNVVCIQVENEYDHLMNYGRDRISREDAVAYFERLKVMLEDLEIDIPKTANEAQFLRGRGIVDTRTYYPNIPTFYDWMWEFEHFDEKIQHAREEQPGCPTAVMELQKGWFGSHGHPDYYPDLNHTQAVAKSVLIQGASVLNFYMFTGGTTFPFWGSRADAWAADRWGTVCNFDPIGCGVTTSYDFGGSFIREWGELLEGGYAWIRAFTRFAEDFKTLIIESDRSDAIQVLSGGSEVRLVGRDGSHQDDGLSDPSQKFRVFTREKNGQALVCIRNISPEDRTVDVGWSRSRRRLFKGLEVRARETLLLPVDIRVPDSRITIKTSTSELLFSKKTGKRILFGLYGKQGRPGETVLTAPSAKCRVLSGDVKIRREGARFRLSYTHTGVQIVGIGRDLLFLLDEESAGRLDVLDHAILFSSAYFIREIDQKPERIALKADLRADSRNDFSYFGEAPLKTAEINGKALSVRHDANLLRSGFSFHCPPQKGIGLEWLGNWRIMADSKEAEESYEDSSWMELEGPVSLETAGLLEHGYVWYRGAFDLPAGCVEAALHYTGNDIDRQFIFINGRLVRRGRISSAEIDIRDAVRPGRNALAVLYQNFYHTKSHPHEGPIIKTSGVMKPIVIEGGSKGNPFRVEIVKLRVRQHLSGVLDGYMTEGHDDSAWPQVKPAFKYAMHESAGAILWMRRKFRVLRASGFRAAVKLYIPGADSRCLIYINGKPTGWYEAIGPQDEFYIPDSFLKKENLLAVILEGPRGFLAEPVWGTFYQTMDAGIRLSLRSSGNP